MLTIRSSQLNALASSGREALVARLVERVRERHAPGFAFLGAEGVRALVAECLQACLQQGYATPQHLVLAVDSLFGQAARLQAGPAAALRSVLLELDARERLSLLETVPPVAGLAPSA